MDDAPLGLGPVNTEALIRRCFLDIADARRPLEEIVRALNGQPLDFSDPEFNRACAGATIAALNASQTALQVIYQLVTERNLDYIEAESHPVYEWPDLPSSTDL